MTGTLLLKVCHLKLKLSFKVRPKSVKTETLIKTSIKKLTFLGMELVCKPVSSSVIPEVANPGSPLNPLSNSGVHSGIHLLHIVAPVILNLFKLIVADSPENKEMVPDSRNLPNSSGSIWESVSKF
jgi:hypothetical protein